MPRALYSALIGIDAAWMIALVPMLENLELIAEVIWAMTAGGAFASRAKRSVPGGSFERLKPPAALPNAAALEGSASICSMPYTPRIALPMIGLSLSISAWLVLFKT